MKGPLASFLLGGFLAGGLLAAEPQYRIRLPEEAAVTGPQITLGDIADVLGPRVEKVRKVRGVVLAKAAPPDRVLKVGKGLVRIVLRKEGYDLREIELVGAETTLVRTQSQSWSPAELLPAARALILAKLAESPENVEIRPMGEGEELNLPAGKVTAQIRPPLSGRYEGSLLLTADLSVDGRPFRTLPLRLNVEVFRPVVVALERIEKGGKFTRENIGLVRKPASSIPQGAFGELKDILGRTAGLYVAPDTILRHQAIFDPPVVRRGRQVKALIRKGRVELSVDVRALHDAKAGERVRVENTRSGKALVGTVLDENTVLLEKDGP